MKTYSAGMLKTFTECPQKFSLIFNEHLEIPNDNTFAEIGKQIHSLINYKLSNLDIEKMSGSLDNPENAELKRLWENFVGFNIKDTFASEYTLNVILNSQTRLTGRVDAIRKDDLTIEILDWKTGSSKNIDVENDMQTIVYLYCIYRLFNEKGDIKSCENLSMTYYFLKEKTSKTVRFSVEKYKKFEQILNNLTKKIENSNFENPYLSTDCEKCSFRPVCKGAYEGLNNVL